jgi:hypothetical protein
VIPAAEFPPKTLELIGALAIEHGSADDALTFFLTLLHSRHFSLGYPLFSEMFFGRKMDLIKDALVYFKDGAEDNDGLPVSEYESLINRLAELKSLGQRRNDVMHGVVCLPQVEGETATLRRPTRRGRGEKLDNASLEKLLEGFRRVMGQVMIGLTRIVPDLEKRRETAEKKRVGDTVRIVTRTFRADVGGKTVKVLRSTREILPSDQAARPARRKRSTAHPRT